MEAAERARVRDVLWPAAADEPFTVWAVLDFARDPHVRGAVVASRLHHDCLYAGPLPDALRQVAPHVVELPPGHAWLDQLLDAGYGRAWGIFARIADPTQLRHQLRKVLKVIDPLGRTLLFRFYDPRVLGAFLRTCSVEQLREMFGPVQAFVAEDGDGAVLHEFSLDVNGRLAERAFGIRAS